MFERIRNVELKLKENHAWDINLTRIWQSFRLALLGSDSASFCMRFPVSGKKRNHISYCFSVGVASLNSFSHTLDHSHEAIGEGSLLGESSKSSP